MFEVCDFIEGIHEEVYVMYACMYDCIQSLSRGAVLRRHGRIFNALHSVCAQTVGMSVRLVMSCCSVQMDSVQQQIRAAPVDADLQTCVLSAWHADCIDL